MKIRVFQAVLLAVFVGAVIFLVPDPPVTNAADDLFSVAGDNKKRLRDMGDLSHAEVVSEGRLAALAVLTDAAAADDSYRVLVDLSDTTNYSHNNTSGIIVTGINAEMAISAATANWEYVLLVVTAIDGSSADTKAFEAVFTSTAGSDVQRKAWEYPGAGIEIIEIASADINIAAITTSTDLASPAGTTQAAVGDIILFADEKSGSATLRGFMAVYYYSY